MTTPTPIKKQNKLAVQTNDVCFYDWLKPTALDRCQTNNLYIIYYLSHLFMWLLF